MSLGARNPSRSLRASKGYYVMTILCPKWSLLSLGSKMRACAHLLFPVPHLSTSYKSQDPKHASPFSPQLSYVCSLSFRIFMHRLKSRSIVGPNISGDFSDRRKEGETGPTIRRFATVNGRASLGFGKKWFVRAF